MNPTMKNAEKIRLERFVARMSLSLNVVEVGQADLNQRPRHLRCRALPTKLLTQPSDNPAYQAFAKLG